jgi:hypothetical protein
MTDSTTGPEADARRAALLAQLNGEPGIEANDIPPSVTPATDTPAPRRAHWSLVIAIIWAVAAVIVGLVFIFGVNAETYGGDAYTGIEAAIVTAVHAIGWVIISSGVLGLVIAGTRVRQTT